MPLEAALAQLGEQVPDLEYVALAQPDELADLALAGPLPEVMPKLAAAYHLQAVACGDLWILGPGTAPEHGVEALLAGLPEPEVKAARDLLQGDPKVPLVERAADHLIDWQKEAEAALRPRWQAQPAVGDGPGWRPLELTDEETRLIRRVAAAGGLMPLITGLNQLDRPIPWVGIRAGQGGDGMSVELGIRLPDGRVNWSAFGGVRSREPITPGDQAYRLAWLPDRMDSPWRGTSYLAQSVTLRLAEPPERVGRKLSERVGVEVDCWVDGQAAWLIQVEDRPLWQVFEAFAVASGRLWGPLVDAPAYRLRPAADNRAYLFRCLPLRERLAALLLLHRSQRVQGPVLWSALSEAQREALRRGEQLPVEALTPEQRVLLDAVAAPLYRVYPMLDQLGNLAILHRTGPVPAAWTFAGTAVNLAVDTGDGSFTFPVIQGDHESRKRLNDVAAPTGNLCSWVNTPGKPDGARVLGEPRRARGAAAG